jgi:DNA polymerase III gamma/tau subunit
MSILGNIMSSILGRQAPPPAPPPTPTEAAKAATAPAEPRRAEPAPSPAPPATPTHSKPQASVETPSAKPAAATPTSTPSAQVDVAAVLDKRAEEVDEELNWRTSIVDLMKLLKLDSSLAARKTLAKELSYTGDTKDSAAMNVWLHKQVMLKLAQGGGKLPSDMTH